MPVRDVRSYYHMNRDRILEWGRIWRLKHKDQIRDKDKKYRSKNKEKLKKYHREYDSKRGKELIQRRTTAALVWYSNGKPECAKCGEANIRNLEIDHINNRGALHRKKSGNMRSSVVIKN